MLKKSKMHRLTTERVSKLRAMMGKYAIACHRKKELVFLQDKEVLVWTHYLANAKIFDTKESALEYMKKCEYDNSKVVQIDTKYLPCFVSEDI